MKISSHVKLNRYMNTCWGSDRYKALELAEELANQVEKKEKSDLIIEALTSHKDERLMIAFLGDCWEYGPNLARVLGARQERHIGQPSKFMGSKAQPNQRSS